MNEISKTVRPGSKTLAFASAITLAILCLLCISAGSLLQLASPPGTATFGPAPHLPAATLAPTLEPSPTLKPSPTATRTPSPTPSISEEDRTYHMEIAEKMEDFNAAWRNFQYQHDQLIKKPVLRFSDGWLTETALALTTLDWAATALSEVEGPEKYRQVEYWLDQLGPEVSTMIDHYTTGIDDWDAKYLKRAIDNIERIVAILAYANKALELIVGQGDL